MRLLTSVGALRKPGSSFVPRPVTQAYNLDTCMTLLPGSRFGSFKVLSDFYNRAVMKFPRKTK